MCNVSNEFLTHFSQFISEKLRKFKKFSGTISGKVKKIEAQAKLWFSYKKKRVSKDSEAAFPRAQ